MAKLALIARTAAATKQGVTISPAVPLATLATAGERKLRVSLDALAAQWDGVGAAGLLISVTVFVSADGTTWRPHAAFTTVGGARAALDPEVPGKDGGLPAMFFPLPPDATQVRAELSLSAPFRLGVTAESTV